MDEALNTCTDIRAIIAEHNLGTPCKMGKLLKISEANNVPLIEDGSQALGAEYNGKMIGSLGKASAFSLGGDMTKTISLGEGGIVATNNDDVANMVNELRNHGDKETKRTYPCFNFRLSEIQALLGVIQFRSVKFQIEYQRQKAKMIIDELPKCLYTPPSYPGTVYKPANYIIGTLYKGKKKSRNEYIQRIRDLGILDSNPRRAIGPGYSTLICDLPAYNKFRTQVRVGVQATECRRLVEEAVWVDWHRYPITDQEIFDMLKILKEAEK